MTKIILILIPLLLTACQAQVDPTLAEESPTTAQAPTQSVSEPAAAVTPSPTPTQAVATPTGHFLYVGNFGDTVITVYETLSDGTLTFVQDAPVAGGVTYLSFDHARQTLYAGTAFSVGGSTQRVFQYSIDATSGELTNTTPGYSQSVFTAQAQGGDFTDVPTSVVLGSSTYSIESGRIELTVGGSAIENYLAGNAPSVLAIH